VVEHRRLVKPYMVQRDQTRSLQQLLQQVVVTDRQPTQVILQVMVGLVEVVDRAVGTVILPQQHPVKATTAEIVTVVVLVLRVVQAVAESVYKAVLQVPQHTTQVVEVME
jgi:hypothetical protein